MQVVGKVSGSAGPLMAASQALAAFTVPVYSAPLQDLFICLFCVCVKLFRKTPALSIKKKTLMKNKSRAEVQNLSDYFPSMRSNFFHSKGFYLNAGLLLAALLVFINQVKSTNQ